MKKKILFAILAVLTLPTVAFALTYFQSTQTLVPFQDATSDLGTTTARYRNLYLSGTCTGCSSGSQTPWTQAIDGAGFALTNAGNIIATYFTATSTTATSTFKQLSFTNATGTNLSVTGSSSFAWMNLGSTTATSFDIPSLTNSLMWTNANGRFVATTTGLVSAGTGISVTASRYVIGGALTITNDGVTSISATSPLVNNLSTGAISLTCPTCSTFTYPFPSAATTTALSFGNITFTNGTGTAATTTASFFSTFLTSLSSNATKYNATGTGVANQSVFQNATFVNSTSTSASSTNLYSDMIQGLTGRFTSITATSSTAGITLADGYSIVRGEQRLFGTTDYNATTTDIISLGSTPYAETVTKMTAVVDCPNGCNNLGTVGFIIKIYTGANRAASTTGTVIGTFAINSTTTVQTFTSFTNTAIAASDSQWLQVTNGSTTQMSFTTDFYGTIQ